MKNQIMIIATILICLSASILFLAYTEKTQREHDENFWSIYFVDPFAQDNHSFAIDNHSADATFHYTAIAGEITLVSEDVFITKDNHQIITVEKTTNPITITVTKDGKEKMIEKK
ncbi:MAG: hypothetical protein WC819_00455 [Parcubacteria group bacterium]|jgi:hypothetical protein